MSAAIAAALKPLFLILFFGSARLIAWGVDKVMPDSKLKRWLFQEKGGFGDDD